MEILIKMMKNFSKKTLKLFKYVITKKKLQIYQMNIILGNCYSNDEIIELSNYLLNMWNKISANPKNVFFKLFCGWTRELLFEVNGDICTPYLHFLLLSDQKNIPLISKLNTIAFISLLRVIYMNINNLNSKIIFNQDVINIDIVPENEFEKVIDELMLPNIRIKQNNSEFEELLTFYQYNRRISSRGGILSKANLERNVALLEY